MHPSSIGFLLVLVALLLCFGFLLRHHLLCRGQVRAPLLRRRGGLLAALGTTAMIPLAFEDAPLAVRVVGMWLATLSIVCVFALLQLGALQMAARVGGADLSQRARSFGYFRRAVSVCVVLCTVICIVCVVPVVLLNSAWIDAVAKLAICVLLLLLNVAFAFTGCSLIRALRGAQNFRLAPTAFAVVPHATTQAAEFRSRHVHAASRLVRGMALATAVSVTLLAIAAAGEVSLLYSVKSESEAVRLERWLLVPALAAVAILVARTPASVGAGAMPEELQVRAAGKTARVAPQVILGRGREDEELGEYDSVRAAQQPQLPGLVIETR
jgi:hypothetical protein